MKTIITAVVAALLVSALGVSALADDTTQLGKDFSMTLGDKLWLNSWTTTLSSNHSSGGDHYTTMTRSGYGNIPNLSFRYKQAFLSMGYLASGTYDFPQYTDMLNDAGAPKLETVSASASRSEFDLNMGYMFVPQLGVTIGYKNVTQNYTITQSAPGVAFSGSGSTTHTYYNGVTFGITGSAPIGNGFSLYGNGVGGFMAVTYSPSASSADSAAYSASELGIAWRAERIPLSASFGYKYQIIDTKSGAVNNPAGSTLPTQTGTDVTQGYVLGLNYTF